MIKLQLDWSALTGLLDSNDELLVEIKKGVKANFISTYVKNLIGGDELKQLRTEMIKSVTNIANKQYGEIVENYGKINSIKLHPVIIKKISESCKSNMYGVITTVVKSVMNEALTDDKIKRQVQSEIDYEINKKIKLEVDKRIKVMMGALNEQ